MYADNESARIVLIQLRVHGIERHSRENWASEYTMSFFRKSFNKVFKSEKPANGLHEPDGEFEDPSLSQAVTTDPSIHMTKSAAWFGRSHRRYFVLHRDVHKLAYVVATSPLINALLRARF